jgi:serine/threonine-protein phosphatase PGAM5
MNRNSHHLCRIARIACLFAWSVPQIGWTASHAAMDSFPRTVYILRHGAYDTSSNGDSPDGPGLTPLGIAQARLVGARLRALPTTISMMIASTMTRARETAAVVHESLPSARMDESSLLRECTPPMRDEEQASAKIKMDHQACQATLDEAFRRYFVPGSGSEQHVVLVCHGNVIRYFVAKALGVDTGSWIGMAVGHASLTVIRVRSDGSLTVLSMGDVGHIPPDFQSGLSSIDPELVVPAVRKRTSRLLKQILPRSTSDGNNSTG